MKYDKNMQTYKNPFHIHKLFGSLLINAITYFNHSKNPKKYNIIYNCDNGGCRIRRTPPFQLLREENNLQICSILQGFIIPRNFEFVRYSYSFNSSSLSICIKFNLFRVFIDRNLNEEEEKA